jgi:uncharacterized protein YjbI with pentapeptide repeats
MGRDIDGEALNDYSGWSVALSADGTTVAIGALYANNAAGTNDTGHVRVYKYNPNKVTEVTDQSSNSFGPVGWDRLGRDIDGEALSDESGRSVALSADGTIVAIGAAYNNNPAGTANTGHVRVYKYNPTKVTEVTDQSNNSFGPVGWDRLGRDIDGETYGDESGWSVALSADGTTVAIGARSADNPAGTTADIGHVRVYKYNPTKVTEVIDQSSNSFGPVGWDRLGRDIDGEIAYASSGYSVALSADGTTVAIGALNANNPAGINTGHVRVYKYNPTKVTEVIDQSSNSFGPVCWDRLGRDIDGEALDDVSGFSVALSADGTIVAIGAIYNNNPAGSLDTGHVRVYKYNPNKVTEVTNQSLSNFGPVGWDRLGIDIDGEAASDYSGRVALSADGTTVAIGANYANNTAGTNNTGHARVYNIATTNAITYTSSSSSIADVCGNLLLIKGVNGTSTITASQSGNTYTGRLDVSGTTYTLQYNPITYTISDASLATVSTYGRVTLTGTAVGTSTITATQPETRNYASKSVTATLDVSGIVTVLGALTIPTKAFGDASFNITAPTTNNPSGAFTYTSSNTAVATVTSGGVVTIVGTGTTTITATQAASGLYTSASVSGSLVVNFGNTSSITRLLTDGAYVIPTPVSNATTTYGSIWNQLGADTVGKVSGDESGTSISVSADGTIVAIGARSNTTNRGTVRVYKYNDVSWNQIGSDINGEASSDYSGQSVSLSANGRVVAIGANMNDGSGNLLADSGHVRIYEFNGTNWVQRGEDIDGEAAADQSGISVSLSEDGNIVAIGAIMNDGSGNALSNSGHVRVYKYNASKSVPQLTDQSAATFGPAGWDRLGADIDGEAVNDQSGFSVSLSADGATLAIGANFNDGTSGTVDTSNNRGHVRVYRYNASKTSPQLTDQSLTTFGPAGWDRMGSDIDGEVAADQSGFSVSLSADGSAVAIGSPLYDVSGVTNAGRVRVFAWNGSSWAQRGQNINGVILNENFGDSVSLSADGSILSVSSFMKVVNYNYNSSTNTWSQIGANVTGAITPASTNITNASLYSPHVYLDATNPTSYNSSTNTWTNIGSVGGNVVMTNMVGTFDANDNGGSFNFNGSTNRGQITVPSTTLTSITYLAVVKTTRLNAGIATIIEFDLDNLLFNTSNHILNVYGRTNSGFSLAAGVWYVVAVTITSGGSITYYVNGVSVLTATGSAFNTTRTLYGIGSGVGGGEYWNGKISALAVYHNRILTASEIANVSNNFQTYRVSLSSQGNILAVGAREYDGTTGTSTNIGVARVYRIDTSGNYTFSSENTAIADVCGNIILPKSVGSTTIAFTQSESGETASRSGTIPLIISGITPTIGALTAPAKNFGDAAFSLTAPTSDSSGAFTYDSSNTAVATVTSGGTVTIVGAGSTTITATQDASGNYTTGSVTASLVVSPIAPSIGALTAPAKNFGDASFNLTAPTSNSDGAFSYTSSVPGVATVTSGGTVTIVGAGTTTITATQDASGNYTGGSSVTASLVVSPIAPSIGALTAPAKNFGDAAFDLTAPTSNSGGAITYTSSVPGVATVTSGGTVTIVGAGTTTITATQDASGNYTTGSVTASLVVSPIAPSIGALSAPAKNFGDASFNLTAPTSNSGGAFTYTSSVPGVATVTSGGTVTIVGAGSTTITATQDASGNYTGGSSVTASLVVSPIAPSIGALSVPAKNFGDASFNLTAPTSDSSGAFTYTSSVPGVATVTSGGTVTVVGAGTTTITATQDASGNYTGGSSVTASLVVSPIAPSIGALTAPAKNFGDAAFDLTAPTSNSDGAFSYTSSVPGVATVTSGGTVTVVGAGSTTITATQDASGNYTGGSSVTASLVVSPITPTYQSISQITKIYSTDVSFSLTAVMSGVSNSSGAYTFSSTSAAIDICGGVATILAYTPSAITITATQAASGNYNASGSTTFAVLVNRKVPSYGSFSVPAKTYEDAPFSIAAYAPITDSTGVPFTYTSSEPTVATINSDGTVVTIIGQGYTTITASQAAGGNYAASSTTTSFLVNRAAPTFLKAFTIPNKTFGDASFSLLPFTEGLDNTDGTYHFTSSNAQLVSISEVDGVTATILAYTPTPITIYVAIDACGNYAASSTSGTLTVARAAPSIGALSAPAKNFGDASFNLTAPTNNSGGAFTYTSSAPAVATVTSTGGTVTIVGAGTTTITATQDASGNYTTGSVTASLVVSPIAPTIGALSVPAKNFGDASFNLTAPTSDSSGAFTYTSSVPGVATVTSGGTVTIVGAGSTTITATQAASADGNYTGGSSVTASLVVSASLSNFTVPTGKVYGDISFNLTDPTTIDNTVGFTFTSGNSAVATISGRTVTIVGAGSSVITASQAATENRAQMDISATLVVARQTPVITLAAITKTYGSAQFRLTPTSTNTDDVSGAALSFTSSNTSVASIVDTSFVSINGVGEATITIAIAETANFTDGSGSVVVTVNKGIPVLSTFSVNANKTYGSAPFAVLTAPTSASAGAITYSSSDTGIATIDNSGVITLIAAGYVNFTATQAATTLYNSATKTSNTMTVHRQAIALTRDSPSLEIVNKTYGDEYFIVSATNAASGGALTYESDTPSVAGVINASTGVISVVSVGTATITATRAQTAQYTSDPVSWTIQVARATTTLTGLTDLSRNVTVAPFAVTASSASDGAFSYALQDPSSSILTIHPTSGLVRLLSPGSAVIVASQAQGTLYEAPNSITATITVSSAGNALEALTLTTIANYSDVNLNDAIINNANISGSNFAGAKLTGATFTGASIIGATFTNATLVRANLSGVSISRTDFTNADLSGATLTGVDASGTIFNNASLANVNLTGANVTNVNFTNTIIKGANITDVSFTPLQKLQLLKKSDNRDIAAIAISSVSGPTILSAISASSPARTIANLDLSNAATRVAVYIPETSTTPDGPITDISLDVVNNTIFYLPINENEYFRIGNIVYYSSSGVIRKYTTNEIIEVITYDNKPVWLIVGSIIGLVLQTNTMNASSFVVPTSKLSTDTTPFMPITLPTSNSDAPIVYSSSSPHLATINETTGEITITGNGNGLVTFTATQVQNATYGPATITSNTLLIDQYLHFSLVGLNQSFNLTTLASLDTLNLIADTTDATAVFYVRLSDMTDIFKYQSDAVDVNDISATDLKYYVFNRKWPAELKINPSHAMLNKTESAGMLGTKEIFIDNKMFVKHDFVRYLALKLFNTIHGVDLFANETDLQENATYYGESIRHNIHEIMSGISTTSGDESMACDASGNKYLTNSASGNTNLCRELMRQIAAAVASRFYNNGADNAGMKTVPLREEDTITFKVTIQAAATQNILTGVTEIPSRSYTIKLVLKSSVTSVTNANTVISDSEMFPNSYPYSSSVTSIAPDSEAAATVYNIYSPPAAIPFSRFGYDGWYYTNSSAWVGVNSGVRNHVKWLVPANRSGSSTVGELQYVRMNLKIYNKTAVPYLMVYTQSGSWRKYIVSGGGSSLTNGTKYSFYMNFNSYSREPAMIGYNNAALVISVGSGAFASNEVITNITLETDSGATAGSVEFTLASVIVGEIASGVPSEKEYGFLAQVPSAYP